MSRLTALKLSPGLKPDSPTRIIHVWVMTSLSLRYKNRFCRVKFNNVSDKYGCKIFLVHIKL